MTFSPALRKLALSVHLTASVGWIGAVIAYLALGIAAVTSSDTQTVRAAWTAMELTGWWVIVPLALAALLTGLAMSVGTRWGLFRHYWVLLSLGLTLVCTAVLLLHMPAVSAMANQARDASGADGRALGGDLVHPAIGLALLLLVMGLNVYKPSGLTAYGWRKQREERLAHSAERRAMPSDVAHTPARNTHRRSTVGGLAARAGYFTLHLAEMWFVMLVGMALFMVVTLGVTAQGYTGLSEPTSSGFQVGMSLFMVAPMAAWMRLRGCGWREYGGMSGVMLLSTGAGFVLGAFELRDVQQWVSTNQHMLMLICMLAFMLYRHEHYTRGYSFGRGTGASRRKLVVNA